MIGKANSRSAPLVELTNRGALSYRKTLPCRFCWCSQKKCTSNYKKYWTQVGLQGIDSILSVLVNRWASRSVESSVISRDLNSSQRVVQYNEEISRSLLEQPRLSSKQANYLEFILTARLDNALYRLFVLCKVKHPDFGPSQRIEIWKAAMRYPLLDIDVWKGDPIVRKWLSGEVSTENLYEESVQRQVLRLGEVESGVFGTISSKSGQALVLSALDSILRTQLLCSIAHHADCIHINSIDARQELLEEFLLREKQWRIVDPLGK